MIIPFGITAYKQGKKKIIGRFAKSQVDRNRVVCFEIILMFAIVIIRPGGSYLRTQVMFTIYGMNGGFMDGFSKSMR